MTTKQFTLYAPNPCRPSALIHIQAQEYATLREASEAITGRYGYYMAMEIVGRAFVLSASEALKFAAHKLPLTMGIAGEGYMELPVNVDGQTDRLRWVSDEELATTNENQ